jgi:hypothetical protein
MADKAEVYGFTAGEIEIMARAWKCMKGKPKVPTINVLSWFAFIPNTIIQIDFDKLAAKCELKDSQSASNALAAAKRAASLKEVKDFTPRESEITIRAWSCMIEEAEVSLQCWQLVQERSTH